MEVSSPAWVDARSGSSWVEVHVMFIALASIRGRETREGDTDDDILLRLVSKVLFHPRTVHVSCAPSRVGNPWLLSDVDRHCHRVGWIDALCQVYRDIPSHVVNVLNGSHPMHAMVLRCREPDQPVDRCALQGVQGHSIQHGQCFKRIAPNAYNGAAVPNPDRPVTDLHAASGRFARTYMNARFSQDRTCATYEQTCPVKTKCVPHMSKLVLNSSNMVE